MNLVLDLGNSRCKWALANSGQEAAGLAQGGALAYGEDFALTLDDSFSTLPRPEHVVAVCVAATGHLQTLAQWVQSRWGLEVQAIITRAAQLGVTNSYKNPTSLGADRWAALIAARARLPGAACVVDCGTALTIDALDQNGVYRGGVILPGLALMRAALLRTQGVRDVVGSAGSTLAQSTADGVAAGILFGLAGAIDRILDEQAALLGATPQVLITGGDAQSLHTLLRHDVQHAPDLVLEGVARIARAGGPA
jgi:type III pantothenate kinase